MEEQKKKEITTHKVKYEKIKQIKDSFLKFFKTLWKKVFALFCKVFQKTKLWFSSFFSKIKKSFPVVFSKIKTFFFKTFQKIKKGLSFVFLKIKAFFQKSYVVCKKFFIYLKSLKRSTKTLIVSILVVVLVFTGEFIYMSNIKTNDLSSYNILMETLEYIGNTNYQEEFTTSTYIEEENLEIAYQDYIIYKAIENNYKFYLPLLKAVKQTNNELRSSINTQLVELEIEMQNLYNLYNIFKDQVQIYQDNITLMQRQHRYVRERMENVIIISNSLLPEIENYISLYGNIEMTDKLPIYLTKLQFHYAAVIQNKISLGLDTLANLNDLENIMEKVETLEPNSTNIYVTDFIDAYENYNAYNYYYANDKFVYYQSLSAGIVKNYVQAFYSFLTQANYN